MKVVMFVYNDVAHDSRVLREAEALVEAGHSVTILGRPSDPTSTRQEREERDGFEVWRIPLPSGWRLPWTFLRFPWHMRRWVVGRMMRGLRARPPRPADLLTGALIGLAAAAWSLVRLPTHLAGRLLRQRRPGRPGGSLADWLVHWRWATLGWARRAAALAPEADAYHGHDLSGLPAAVEAARVHRSWAIYDSHEIFLESGSNATRPVWARAIFSRWEASLARRADALITVNDALAKVLDERLRPRRTVVIHNCPPRWDPPARQPDYLREAAGIPPGDPVVLYHGAFSAHRGLETMAAALLEPGLERAHAVYLGYGSARSHLDRLAERPGLKGRLHVLDAVPPDVLIPWVASADVDVMALEPSTINHYLSTPNKLFEALAAGTPVVASDFPELRRILQPDSGAPLGELCQPADVSDVARAIRAILDLEPEARAAFRARCLAAAHARWNWETEARRLTELYAEIPMDRPLAATEGLAEPA